MKWHKTSEKLPEINKKVLGLRSYADGDLGYFIVKYSPASITKWLTQDWEVINRIVWWAELDVPDELSPKNHV